MEYRGQGRLVNEAYERRNEGPAKTNEGLEKANEGGEGNELTREQSKALAEAVLDALGVGQENIDEEERDVIRRAVEDYRRRKAQKAGG